MATATEIEVNESVTVEKYRLGWESQHLVLKWTSKSSEKDLKLLVDSLDAAKSGGKVENLGLMKWRNHPDSLAISITTAMCDPEKLKHLNGLTVDLGRSAVLWHNLATILESRPQLNYLNIVDLRSDGLEKEDDEDQNISVIGWLEFCASLSNSRGLRSLILHIKLNQLRAESLAQALSNNCSLQDICLFSMNKDPLQWWDWVFADGIRKNTSITDISFYNDNYLDDKINRPWLSTILPRPNLHSLRVENLDDSDIAALTKFLESDDKATNFCELDIFFPQPMTFEFCNAIRSCRSLRELKVSISIEPPINFFSSLAESNIDRLRIDIPATNTALPNLTPLQQMHQLTSLILVGTITRQHFSVVCRLLVSNSCSLSSLHICQFEQKTSEKVDPSGVMTDLRRTLAINRSLTYLFVRFGPDDCSAWKPFDMELAASFKTHQLLVSGHSWPALSTAALAKNRNRHDNWARISPMLAFVRANHHHPFQFSIFPLIPSILHLIPHYEDSDTSTFINLDQFCHSRFAKHHLFPK